MGTNYYWHNKRPCPTCGHAEEPIHIGKSSAGWCFSLHVYPDDLDLKIHDLDDWREKFAIPGTHVEDEYGRRVAPEEMLKEISGRELGKRWRRGRSFSGYTSEGHFHAQNHSERGPKGLLRHAVDSRHCIGHGRGTWDLIVGEFS